MPRRYFCLYGQIYYKCPWAPQLLQLQLKLFNHLICSAFWGVIYGQTYNVAIHNDNDHADVQNSWHNANGQLICLDSVLQETVESV